MARIPAGVGVFEPNKDYYTKFGELPNKTRTDSKRNSEEKEYLKVIHRRQEKFKKMVDSAGNKEGDSTVEGSFGNADEGGQTKKKSAEEAGKNEGGLLSNVSGKSEEASGDRESNLLKIWKNRGKILEGIKNNIFRKEDVVQIADERRVVCESCEHLDREGTKCASHLAPKPCCGQCGCSIKLKTFSMSSECPVGKWKAVMNEEEEKEFEEKSGIKI